MAATVIVPFGFNVNPVGSVVEVVSVTSVGKNAAPSKVSFPKTVGIVPPVVPLIGSGVSLSALIVVTITVVVASSQINGFAFWQIVYEIT
ncbi:hypothetical protein FLA105534_00007 [Flavobacterium bizetiae]|nr:hypothetical protein FLA105534_00007 [Flavobacterium bizetiae]